MANAFIVSDLATKQIVQSLHATGKLINTVDKSKSKDFQQTTYTPGLTVRIPIEHQPSVTSGRVANVQTVTNLETDVTIAQYNSAEDFTSIEKSYSMDNEKDVRRYAHKMALRLVREMEVTGFEYMMQQTGNVVGTPGSDPGALRTWGEARAKITDALAPDRDYYAAVNPMGMVALTDSLKGATNPGKEISNQYLRGRMKRAAGLNFYESQSIARQTAGTTSDFAGAMASTATSGATTLSLDNLGTGTITAGTKLRIAAVQAVDPETKNSLSYVKDITVTADATITGNAATVSISPTLYDSTSSHQNVSAMPQSAAVVTIVSSGTASTVDAQNVVYDKDAYTLVSVPLAKAQGNYHSFANYEGVQIRVGYGAWDGTNDTQMLRCDAVWGWGKLREDHACIVWGD
ncbi:MAG: hypothetical protein GY861_14690 [bacterium]|nr:hypothetical protein [bacterium]